MLVSLVQGSGHDAFVLAGVGRREMTQWAVPLGTGGDF